MEYTRQHAEMAINEKYGANAPYILNKINENLDWLDRYNRQNDARMARFEYEFILEMAENWNENLLTPVTAQVGGGASLCWWSDRTACTIIKKTAKTITIQADRAQRTDDNGMSESQTYTYTADPEGSTYVCRWSDKRNRYIWNGQAIINGRHEYYDYSF